MRTLHVALLAVPLLALGLAGPAAAQEAPPTEPPSAGEADPPLPAKDVAPEAPMEPALPELPAAALPDLHAEALCPPSLPCMEGGPFAIWPRMRLRAGWEFVQPDPSVPFIGNNDGFLLDQARIGLEGTYLGRVDFRLVLDAVSALPGPANDPVHPVFGAARDAWLRFNLHDLFGVTVGQIFLPVDREGQMSRQDLNFTTRSVASEGLRGGRGFAVRGLSPGREVGLVVGKQGAALGALELDYRLAISNGNRDNVFGNDNKLPAISGRVGVGYARGEGAEREELVGLGLAGRWNPRTVGELPNLFHETDTQGSIDFFLDAFGIELLAQAIVRRTSFDSVFVEVDPARYDSALGLTSWIVLDEPLGLPMFGFKPGFRFSYYDPKAAFLDDQMTELTFGLRYDPPTDLPVFFMTEYTMLLEPGADGGPSTRAVDNNRVVALVQFDLGLPRTRF